MQVANTNPTAFPYYPNTMIGMCVISYEDIGTIASQIAAETDQTVVWGPVEKKNVLTGIPESLAFVTKRNSTEEYTVVIRGTDFASLTSWLKEDLEIDKTEEFQQYVPSAPAGARISKATSNGLADVLGLFDTDRKYPALVDFLQATKPQYLYVTGHSLGGTLTPPLFAYLNDQLNGEGHVSNMACWSFAGLTSGNEKFASYFNSLFNSEFPWRIHNTLDVAPYCFQYESSVREIYVPEDLHWDLAEKALWDTIFDEANGIGYTQPAGDQQIQGVFCTDKKCVANTKSAADQAMYQHHSTTYQGLVGTFYPLT